MRTTATPYGCSALRVRRGTARTVQLGTLLLRTGGCAPTVKLLRLCVLVQCCERSCGLDAALDVFIRQLILLRRVTHEMPSTNKKKKKCRSRVKEVDEALSTLVDEQQDGTLASGEKAAFTAEDEKVITKFVSKYPKTGKETHGVRLGSSI